MERKYQNLKQFLVQPGQTVAGLMRQFNGLRVEAKKCRVAMSTFYGWCRGDAVPTKEWDIQALSQLTGIDQDKLFAE